MANDKYLLSSVDSSLKLMDLLSVQPNLGVAELSKALGMGKATVFRMLYTLEKNHYVTKSADAKYSLSVKFANYGSMVLERQSVVQTCIPFMRELRDLYNETVHLATLTDNGQLLFVYRELSTSSIHMTSHIGALKDAYCTGTGKVLLAYLEPELQEKFLAAYDYQPYTENTVKNAEELRQLLTLICQQGYAEDNEEHEPGLYCLAAPINDHTGKCFAALSVSGPAVRMKSQKVAITLSVKEFASKISTLLGYMGQ